MQAEAYKKGDVVALVHRRRGGYVYGHTQREGARVVYWTDFFRMGEAVFAEAVSSAAVYDARRLPALLTEPACWAQGQG